MSERSQASLCAPRSVTIVEGLPLLCSSIAHSTTAHPWDLGLVLGPLPCRHLPRVTGASVDEWTRTDCAPVDPGAVQIPSAAPSVSGSQPAGVTRPASQGQPRTPALMLGASRRQGSSGVPACGKGARPRGIVLSVDGEGSRPEVPAACSGECVWLQQPSQLAGTTPAGSPSSRTQRHLRTGRRMTGWIRACQMPGDAGSPRKS